MGRWLGGVDQQLRAVLLSAFTSQRLTTLATAENGEDPLSVTQLIGSGTVSPVLDTTCSLGGVPGAAIRYLQ